MIEDKEHGVKIAENHNEELWEKFRKGREDSIKQLEDSLEIEKALLLLGRRKVEEAARKSKK